MSSVLLWYLKLNVSKRRTCTRLDDLDLNDFFFNLPQSISLKYNSQSLVGNFKMEIILLQIYFVFYLRGLQHTVDRRNPIVGVTNIKVKTFDG